MVFGFDVLCDCILRIASINSTGPAAYPILQPVIACPFDTPFVVSVRLNNLGSTCAGVQKLKSSYARCSYISSDIIQIFGYLINTSVNFFNSSQLYPAPVGFEGELNISHFVLGVIASSNSLAVNL